VWWEYLIYFGSMLWEGAWNLMHCRYCVCVYEREREKEKGERGYEYTFCLWHCVWMVKVRVTTPFHNELTCHPPSSLLFSLLSSLFHSLLSHIPHINFFINFKYYYYIIHHVLSSLHFPPFLLSTFLIDSTQCLLVL